jgi:competence protein ComEC
MLAVPCVLLFVATALGIGAADLTQLPVALAACALALGCLATCVAGWRQRGTAVAALCTLMAVGSFAARRTQAPQIMPPGCLQADGVAEAAFRVRVDAPVQRQVEGGQVRYRTVVALVAEQQGSTWLPRSGRVAVRLRTGVPVVRGDTLQVRLRLMPLPAPHNPIDADPVARGRRLQLAGTAWVRSEHALVASGTGFWAQIDALRGALGQHLEIALPAPTAALAKALALGDTASVSPEQRDAWADAGMAHLLSVSGLHVGLVSAALMAVLSAVLRHIPAVARRYSTRRLAALLSLPGLVGFCLLTGAPPPAVRAATMAAALILGLALGTPSAPKNAWGVAGLLMLLGSPMALYDAGFQLSFAAVAALLWLVPQRPAPEADLSAPRVPQLLSRLLCNVVSGLQVCLAASLVTVPLCALYFGRIALCAPLVNLLAVPLGSALGTPLALGVCAAKVLHTWTGLQVTAPLALALHAVLQTLDSLARTVAAQPFATFDLAAFGWLTLLAYGLFLMAVYSRKKLWVGCGAAAALGTLLFVSFFPIVRSPLVLADALPNASADAPPASLPDPSRQMRPSSLPTVAALPGRLTVRHIYVGQGDATLVTLPHGRHLLIDGGGAVLQGDADPGRLVLVPLLRQLGVRRLELVVLTHPHPDHVGGLVAVTQHFAVNHFWSNGSGAQIPPVRAVLQQVRRQGAQVRTVASLPHSLCLDGVRVDVLHPRPPAPRTFYEDFSANDNSVVLRLTYGQRSVLLSGDIEARAEALLLPKLGGPVDVLKAPHHGSRTSSSDIFLAALRPHAVVISCGDDNHYGFPHPEPLQRFAAVNAQVWRTDADGMVTYSTDGRTWTLHSVRPRPAPVQSSRAELTGNPALKRG